MQYISQIKKKAENATVELPQKLFSILVVPKINKKPQLKEINTRDEYDIGRLRPEHKRIRTSDSLNKN